MRLIYHHRTLGDGAEGIHIREMVSALRQLGHDVRVVALVDNEEAREGKPKAAEQKRGWSTISRLIPDGAYEMAELAYNPIARHMVSRAIEEFKPDFLFDRYNSYSIGAISAARRLNSPVILEVNAPVALERSQYDEKLPLRFPKLAAKYERRIFSQADHIYTVSSPLRDFVVTQRGLPEDLVTVICKGANPRSFMPGADASNARSDYALEGKIVIGFVGILRPWHGIELLLEAFSVLATDFEDIHLLIVGDGPSQEDLQGEARRMKIGDRVTFTGRVPHKQVAACVAAMDVAVSPRATFYASPMKILEYMAMGIATIGPRMPNIEDLITDGQDGLLFEPDCARSLTSVLRHLVTDDSIRQSLGDAARREVETNLNWENNARRVVDLAQSLIEGRPNKP